ncbi:hypothetical protein CLAFUW4_05642 [Fulvia fulva]|uniref:Uncharacterized protein n=1 Tax=Passalora fulva TaxID=5499 RepID=A0A9Q8LJ15_PASFU|nr:uncharacterized protein CLAFUR5_05783 [Fulvia fulva]KAK4624126.1 hypothetical protein CLAFUR4_05637 [Fulvia fulva]KAK4625747.1 hypothetical protein CLAFUR0_05645 [Fulvia fulva]UJO17498.1 hypothetical protein CLAFUR5_05783 [Fulvia fulva]WPV14451.1 hypothetical protein CLAFUW4_05642 [Fulvia fulva]WPV29787.1 hypothetical protein CLAFUW7_05641 [Fulvia fulva]
MTEAALDVSMKATRARLGATDDWNCNLSEDESEELERLEEEYQQDKWRLERQYPDTGKIFKKTTRPEKGVRSTLRMGSLLSREVKVEDVVVTEEEAVTSKTGVDAWEYWREGWKSLEEEIAESEEERKAAGIEYSWYNSTATCQTAVEEEYASGNEQEESSDESQSEVDNDERPETGRSTWPVPSNPDDTDSFALLELQGQHSSLGSLLEHKVRPRLETRQQHRDCLTEALLGLPVMV